MKLRGIEFGKVFCAPGARGFFGEGYRYHAIARLLGMTWEGTGFVAKTITAEARMGNMPLAKDDLHPAQWHPKCIVVKPRYGVVLNAVGLSNIGAYSLLKAGRWQARKEPFMLSFMAVGLTPAARLDELRYFVNLLRSHLRDFVAPVALQLNFGCPNTDHPPLELFEELNDMLNIAGELAIPLVVNFNPLVPVEIAETAANHQFCDALWVANTVPWGSPGIDWKKLFGSTTSPLLRRGFKQEGGLSGPPALPLVVGKLRELRAAGITKPIVAGNGIQHARAMRELYAAGADAFAIGIVAMMRPWRMRRIIAEAKHFPMATL